jgi:hypothetical protein
MQRSTGLNNTWLVVTVQGKAGLLCSWGATFNARSLEMFYLRYINELMQSNLPEVCFIRGVYCSIAKEQARLSKCTMAPVLKHPTFAEC